MAFTNFDTKEINCKVIYFGPEGAGKTTNLRAIHDATSAEVQSGLLELGSVSGAGNFFSFLPISMGHVKDFHLKMHIFVLPQNNICDTVPSVILKGVDGFVFVADSRIEKMAENIDSLLATRRILSEQGCNSIDMPMVVQYNKRDLSGIVPLEILRKEFNAQGVPDQEAVAHRSIGTMETLQKMSKQVINKLAIS